MSDMSKMNNKWLVHCTNHEWFALNEFFVLILQLRLTLVAVDIDGGPNCEADRLQVDGFDICGKFENRTSKFLFLLFSV